MAKTIVINLASEMDARGFERLQKELKAADSATSSAAASSGSSLRGLFDGIKSHWMAIVGVITAAGASIYSVLKRAFDTETMTVQFKTLMGSMDAAREHMKLLHELGDTPPFSLDEFAKASRTLMVMSGGALGLRNSLNLVGDAAAATGNSIDVVSDVVGRCYAYIKDGQPIGRMGLMMVNLGLVTPKVVAEIEALQKAGADSQEIWAAFTAAMGKFKGAMDETANTGAGMVGQMKEEWANATERVGAAFSNAAKGGMKQLIDRMHQLNEDGSIERWANSLCAALNSVLAVAGKVGSAFSYIWTLAGKMDQAIGDFEEKHLLGGGRQVGYSGRAVSERKVREEYARMKALEANAGAGSGVAAAAQTGAAAAKDTEAERIRADLAAAAAGRKSAAEKHAEQTALAALDSLFAEDQTEMKRAAAQEKLFEKFDADNARAEYNLGVIAAGPAARKNLRAQQFDAEERLDGLKEDIRKGDLARSMGRKQYADAYRAKKEATEEQGKQDKYWDKHMQNLAKREAAGTHLGKKDRENLDAWRKQNEEIANRADALGQLPEAESDLNDVVSELQKLDTDIKQALSAMGVK